jgi:drug/metabolite transporter (DMT)-like permease
VTLDRRVVLPLLAAAATGVQVGAGMVATRFVIDQSAPASLAMLRYVLGFLTLLPAVLIAGRTPIARRDLLPIAALGIGQFGILIALLNFGLQYIPSARAALIFATFPLMTLVLAVALRRERLTAAKLAGVLLTIAGVAFALGNRSAASGPASWLGDAAVFASTLTGAVCSVLYRPYLQRYPALPVSAFAMLASVMFLAVLAAGEGFFAHPPRFDTSGWLAVAFIGVSSGIGYFLWLYALGHAAPTRVTIFLSLSPVTAAALGAATLGEPVTVHLVGGVVCVSAGLWLATSNWRQARILSERSGDE